MYKPSLSLIKTNEQKLQNGCIIWKEKWHTKWCILSQYPRCSTFSVLQIIWQPANWILSRQVTREEHKEGEELRANWLKVRYLLHIIHPQLIFPIFLIKFLNSDTDLLDLTK